MLLPFTIRFMTLDALIMLLGVLVALTPFLGFPNSWDQIILLVAGILIVLLGIVVRRRGIRNKVPGTPRVFVDTTSQETVRHEPQQ